MAAFAWHPLGFRPGGLEPRQSPASDNQGNSQVFFSVFIVFYGDDGKSRAKPSRAWFGQALVHVQACTPASPTSPYKPQPHSRPAMWTGGWQVAGQYSHHVRLLTVDQLWGTVQQSAKHMAWLPTPMYIPL